MQRETASTTPVAADQVDHIASAVDSATAGVTYESVRGNVELSDEFMRDFYVHEFFASSDTDEVAVKESVEKPPIRTIAPEAERVPAQTEKTARSLGKTALNFLQGIGKKSRQLYFNTMVTVISSMPGTKTKEELLELDRAQREKYADKDTDGYLTRKWNKIRQNKYELYSWAPTAMLGSLAVGIVMMRGAGYFDAFDTHPKSVTLPEINNGIVTKPLPPTEIHPSVPVAATLPAPAAAVDITPAPKPTYVDAPAPVRKQTTAPVYDTVPAKKTAPTGGKEIVIPIGGATDPDGNIPADMLDPNKVRLERIWYPAEMGPFVGARPTNISVGQGIDTVVNRVVELRKQNPNAVINLNGFSEGSFVARGAARRLQDMGIAVNVQTAGDPSTDIGVLNNPLAEMVKPMTASMGIQRGPEIDGLTSKVSGLDAWGGTATDDPGTMIGKFINIPKDHRIPTDAEIPVQILTDGKETIKVYDAPIRILPAGVTDITPGGPVTTISAPTLMPEVPGPAPEMPAPVDQPLPPVAEPERLPTPSFFGEKPCVDPNGTEYYTAGDAPCAA